MYGFESLCISWALCMHEPTLYATCLSYTVYAKMSHVVAKKDNYKVPSVLVIMAHVIQ